MKHPFKSKKVLAIASTAIVVASITLTLMHSVLVGAAGVATPGAIYNVSGMFFANPSNSGAFDVSPSTAPVFKEHFPLINFDPAQSMQNCKNKTKVDEHTAPFTDVEHVDNGTCTLFLAQRGELEAGEDSLTAFEAVFTAQFTVNTAKQVTFNVTADDGWIFSLGANSSGVQPTYVSGPMKNAPTDGKGPFTGYTVMGAVNGAEAPTLNTVTVNFPAAGTYPIEMDYTQRGGRLTLTLAPIM